MADYIGGYRNVRRGELPKEAVQSVAPVENVLNLRKTVLTKTAYPNAIDTSFSELITPKPPLEETVSVEEFFILYNTIFYDIPIEGNTNSHQFLVNRSTEYIGLPETDDEEIQILLDEITSLRQNLLDTEQELLNLQNTQDQNTNLISPNVFPSEPSSNVSGQVGIGGVSSGGGGGY